MCACWAPPNFQTKRRGWKIGSVWLRPLKSCANNLNSPSVWAIVQREEQWESVLGSEKCVQYEEQKGCLLKLTRSDSSLPEWYISALPDCAVQPGREKISSATAHLLSAQRNSYQQGCSAITILLVPAAQGKQLCRESWSLRREVSSSQLFFGLL